MGVLELCHFVPDPTGASGECEYLVLPKDKLDLLLLQSAGGEIHAALTNPFFGKL